MPPAFLFAFLRATISTSKLISDFENYNAGAVQTMPITESCVLGFAEALRVSEAFSVSAVASVV